MWTEITMRLIVYGQRGRHKQITAGITVATVGERRLKLREILDALGNRCCIA